ncbi:unnamed protein product [Hydatigera taeniaeformis]|uniref:HECT domain-containing protein n=1 Tax=Hydatigena taeniaeformis TaxID=6205 RepID=A0A0R3XAX2_HYDTA|nr:unnamed protein product [Hydatigera taeniaeformis]
MPTAGGSTHSRAVIAFTLPLRALYRRIMRHTNLPVSVSHHSHLSVDVSLSVDSGDGGSGGVAVSGDEPCLVSHYVVEDPDLVVNNNSDNDNLDTDIDDVDEFS